MRVATFGVPNYENNVPPPFVYFYDNVDLIKDSWIKICQIVQEQCQDSEIPNDFKKIVYCKDYHDCNGE